MEAKWNVFSYPKLNLEELFVSISFLLENLVFGLY